MRVDVFGLLDLYLAELGHPQGAENVPSERPACAAPCKAQQPSVGDVLWKALHDSDKETIANLERLLRDQPAGLRVWAVALAKGTSGERKTALQIVGNGDRRAKDVSSPPIDPSRDCPPRRSPAQGCSSAAESRQ